AVATPDRDIVSLQVPSMLPAGSRVLKIAFRAKLQHATQGMFVARDTGEDGKAAEMYAAQLGSTDGARGVPSSAEPPCEARCALSIVVPKAWTAVSNMPAVSSTAAGSGLKRVAFAATPPMSSYLVVLAAGDLVASRATSDGVKLGVYATRGNKDQESYALG